MVLALALTPRPRRMAANASLPVVAPRLSSSTSGATMRLAGAALRLLGRLGVGSSASTLPAASLAAQR